MRHLYHHWRYRRSQDPVNLAIRSCLHLARYWDDLGHYQTADRYLATAIGWASR